MDKVVAKIGKQSKYQTSVSNGKYTLVADEPTPLGGDEGPSPYDFLLMALGSCVAITLRMYADQNRWDLEEVHVQLRQNRIHASDCEDCTSKEGFAHIIEKEIKLNGSLTEEQKVKLMEVADKCPVHRTLLSQIKIETKVII